MQFADDNTIYSSGDNLKVWFQTLKAICFKLCFSSNKSNGCNPSKVQVTWFDTIVLDTGKVSIDVVNSVKLLRKS